MIARVLASLAVLAAPAQPVLVDRALVLGGDAPNVVVFRLADGRSAAYLDRDVVGITTSLDGAVHVLLFTDYPVFAIRLALEPGSFDAAADRLHQIYRLPPQPHPVEFFP